MEFDLQLQIDDCLRSAGIDDMIDRLPWKGGSEGNPDYECLCAELRKMDPPNGRAILLFRARCGLPVAKLKGWGPKRGRKHKRALANVAANGGGDHCCSFMMVSVIGLPLFTICLPFRFQHYHSSFGRLHIQPERLSSPMYVDTSSSLSITNCVRTTLDNCLLFLEGYTTLKWNKYIRNATDICSHHFLL